MAAVDLDQIVPEHLAQPLDGSEPAGSWLRYDRVYDEIKEARSADEEYLPVGIWERDVKRADWDTVAARSFEALSQRTKDLQFAAWLTEGLTHLHGLAGLAKGLSVTAELADNLWTTLYPHIDDEDGAEPRLLVIEWLDRQLPSALDEVQLTAPHTRLVEMFTFGDWRELERREEERVREGDKSRRERAQEANGTARGELRSSISLTPAEHFVRMENDLADVHAAMDRLKTVFDSACGPGSVRMKRLSQSLDRLAKYHREAREQHVEEAQRREAEGGDAQTAPEGAGQAPPANGEQSYTAVDLITAVRSVGDRERAYAVLEAVAARLAELDPHSPAPYLAQRAASFRDQTFADLVMHFVDDERMRQHIFRLLGVGDDVPSDNEESVPDQANR
jgi:type VI secretion system ImpA family protein